MLLLNRHRSLHRVDKGLPVDFEIPSASVSHSPKELHRSELQLLLVIIGSKMLRVISSHSPPVNTAHILETGMKVSPVTISVIINNIATIPKTMNKSDVALRFCFILNVYNNKVNRIQVPDGKYE